jgi:hypothetical protein
VGESCVSLELPPAERRARPVRAVRTRHWLYGLVVVFVCGLPAADFGKPQSMRSMGQYRAEIMMCAKQHRLFHCSCCSRHPRAPRVLRLPPWLLPHRCTLGALWWITILGSAVFCLRLPAAVQTRSITISPGADAVRGARNPNLQLLSPQLKFDWNFWFIYICPCRDN